MFNKDDIGVTAKNNKMWITFNVTIIVKLAGFTNVDSERVRKNIQLRLIDTCIFIYQN